MATFDDFELSNFGGAPVALYQFNIGSHWWAYANSPVQVVLGNEVYAPLAIKDEGITVGDTTQNEEFTIKLPVDNEVFKLFLTTPPSLPCYVVHRRKHVGSQSSPVLWVGTVKSARQSGEAEGTLVCTPITASFERAGLRLAWSRQCPHALYDRNCKVSKSAYAHWIPIEELQSTYIRSATLATVPNGYFAGGFIEWELLPGVTERRGIEGHSNDVIRLLGYTYGLQGVSHVTAYPGCGRDLNTCRDKFNNLPNYGGFPYLPGQSPFDGTRVF